MLRLNPSHQASVLMKLNMKTFMMQFVNKNGQLVERRNLWWTNNAHCQSMTFTWIMRWYIYCTADVFSELRILLATMNILHDSYYINLINTQTKTKYSIIRYGCHGCKFQAIIVMPKIYRVRALKRNCPAVPLENHTLCGRYWVFYMIHFPEGGYVSD